MTARVLPPDTLSTMVEAARPIAQVRTPREVASDLIAVTHFASLTQTVGRLVEYDVQTLRAFFSSPIENDNKKALPGIAFARFNGDRRSLACHQASTAIVLDDDSGAVSLERAAEVWGEWAGLVHTTHSHAPAAPRCRVVLFTSRPMTADEHEIVHAAMTAHAVGEGQQLDPAPKDAARYWFVPAKRPGASYDVVDLAGAPIDVDAVLAESARSDGPPQQPESGSLPLGEKCDGGPGGGAGWEWLDAMAPGVPKSETPDVARIDVATRERRAEAWARTADPAISGKGGHNETMRVASAVVRGFGLGAARGFEVLARAYNPRCMPAWSAGELRHKVNEAERIGSVEWGSKLVAAEKATAREESSAPRLRIWTSGEIWAPLPPPDYLIDRILIRSCVALIHAYGSSLKTWTVVDALLATATGGPWLGRFETKAGRALCIDWESGDYELRRRLQQVSVGRGIDGAVAGVEFVTMPDLYFNSDGFRSTVAALARDRDLICFDSLAAGSGGEDENDSRFASGLNKLKAIGVETGCAFLVLHHSRKGPNGGGAESDPREAIRGSGAIFAACDVVLSLTKGDGESMTCTQTKSRGGPKVEPFAIRVDDTEGGGTTVRAVALEDGEDELSEAKPLERMKGLVLRFLAKDKNLGTRDAIYRRLKGKKATKVEAVKELVERGLIVEHEGAWRLASEVKS